MAVLIGLPSGKHSLACEGIVTGSLLSVTNHRLVLCKGDVIFTVAFLDDQY